MEIRTLEEKALSDIEDLQQLVINKDAEIYKLKLQLQKASEPTEEDSRVIEALRLSVCLDPIYHYNFSTYSSYYIDSIVKNIDKISIEDWEESLISDEKFEELYEKVWFDNYSSSYKMYKMEPYSSSIYVLNVAGYQHVIYGNYDNLNINKLNDLSSDSGFITEYNRDDMTKKIIKSVRECIEKAIPKAKEKLAEKKEDE